MTYFICLKTFFFTSLLFFIKKSFLCVGGGGSGGGCGRDSKEVCSIYWRSRGRRGLIILDGIQQAGTWGQKT